MTPDATLELISTDPVCRSAGIAVVHVGDGAATLRMRVTADMATSLGTAHAAFIVMLADTASGAVAIGVDDTAITTGADVSFLSPARVGDVLVATARLRARSRRSLLIDVAVTTSGAANDGADDPRAARPVAELRSRVVTRAAGLRDGVRD